MKFIEVDFSKDIRIIVKTNRPKTKILGFSEEI